MTAPLDLPAGAALLAAMTPGPFRAHGFGADDHTIRTLDEDDWPSDPIAFCGHNGISDPAANAAGIAWLVNAAPELLRLAAVGQAYIRWRATAPLTNAREESLAEIAAAYRAATEPTP